MSASHQLPHHIPLFRSGRWYTSCDETIVGPAATLSLAPELLIRSDLRAHGLMSNAALDAQRCATILRDAVARFCDGNVTIGGSTQSKECFEDLLWSHCGIPRSLVQRWCAMLQERLEVVLRAHPRGRAPSQGQPELVSLPSNTFTCLEACLEVLVRGARLAIRPSAREPFAAARLIAALVEEGWPCDSLSYYPCTRDTFRNIVPYFPYAIVYGGSELHAALRDRGGVEIRGPERRSVLLDGAAASEDRVATLVDGIAADGGRFCTNVSTIVCTGSPIPWGNAVAEALDRIPLSGAKSSAWPLATCREPRAAKAMEGWILDRLESGDRVLTQRSILQNRHGSLFLAPTLVALARLADHPLAGAEFPFPFATLVRASASELAPGLKRTVEPPIHSAHGAACTRAQQEVPAS